MALNKKEQRLVLDRVFILLGTAMVAVLVIVGGLSWYGYHFATTMVRDELSEQKIYFPAKGSEAINALPEADRKEVSKYAGQQLVNGAQAKVYADNYIHVHLQKIAGGKTYAEISTAAQKDPANAQLQAQKTTLFQGETLRGLLLGSGYSYWTFGMIAKIASIAAFVGAGVMALLVLLGLKHMSKMR